MQWYTKASGATLIAYQPLDGDLTAISALAGTDTLYRRSAADTWTAVTFNAGVTFSAGVIDRAALTGDVTATANSNATSIANNAVTDTDIRDSGALSVIGRSANSTGDPADISATAASGAVLRESGNVLGFGTVAALGLASDSVTQAKIGDDAVGEPELDLVTGDIPANGDCLTYDNATGGGTLAFTTCAGGSGDGLGTDGDKGDITVGGSGTTLEINSGAVGSAEAAALDAGDITTGTFADARIDGSLENDEVKPVESFCLAASDETTNLATGTAKVTWRMPYAFTLLPTVSASNNGVRASINVAQTAGTIVAIDINEGGTSIMTTNKLTIDNSEETSTTAATAATITDTALADDAEIPSTSTLSARRWPRASRSA